MSRRKRGSTGLSGIVLVDKPSGWTSHDVVAKLRGATGEGRIGHAGTLDPAATGLLVMLIGPATRLEPYLSAASKRYVATINFGAETDTEDAEGAVTLTADAPDTLFDSDTARATLAGFVGPHDQVPPAYSAIKVDGTVAHRAARSGDPIALKARAIEVFGAELLATDAAEKTWTVDFTVSKGTYVRSLARDIGRACGSAAHLSGLRRTGSGPCALDDARSVEDVVTLAQAGQLTTCFYDAIAALAVATVAASADDISDGRPLPAPEGVAEGERVAVCDDATLHAVYSRRGDKLVAEAVFPNGVSRDFR